MPKVLPASSGSLLELGASPFFLSLLLEHYSDYSLNLTDEKSNGKCSSVTLRKENYERTFGCVHFNVETERYPYHDKTFDIVLCCELIEHLILDPTHMLMETHRVLKTGGTLVITTPNVTALQKLVFLIKNDWNIYHRYSSYGAYGRHNREWTLRELVQLTNGCGYTVEKAFRVDTYSHSIRYRIFKRLFPRLRDMNVLVARSYGAAKSYYPDNLYQM